MSEQDLTCTYSEDDVLAYFIDMSEGQSEIEMAEHINACSRCTAALAKLNKIAGVAVAMVDAKSKSETSSPKDLPDKIADYKILSVLGEGGMGRVYKAYDQSLDRFLAIKVMKDELASNSDFRERFIGEAKTIAKLNHPNIVHVHAVGTHEKKIYIAMEFVEGQPLTEKIGNRQLDIKAALRLFRQILEGVAAAHALEIIHRDIKPANIMVTNDGRVKILDFGLAKALIVDGTVTTTDGSVLGTIAYMAPEVASGKRASVQSDIYALGLVFYQMVTGTIPFAESSTPLELIERIKTEPFVLPSKLNSSVSKDFERFMLKFCAKKVEERFRSVASSLEELEQQIEREVDSTKLKRQSFINNTAPRVYLQKKRGWDKFLILLPIGLISILAYFIITFPFRKVPTLVIPQTPVQPETKHISSLSVPVEGSSTQHVQTSIVEDLLSPTIPSIHNFKEMEPLTDELFNSPSFVESGDGKWTCENGKITVRSHSSGRAGLVVFGSDCENGAIEVTVSKSESAPSGWFALAMCIQKGNGVDNEVHGSQAIVARYLDGSLELLDRIPYFLPLSQRGAPNFGIVQSSAAVRPVIVGAYTLRMEVINGKNITISLNLQQYLSFIRPEAMKGRFALVAANGSFELSNVSFSALESPPTNSLSIAHP